MEWFTADQHFDHERIIELASRPFKNVKQMNSVIIARYREVVKPDDTVYFIGDVSLRGPENYGYYCRLLNKRLPGRKILILGNHDGLKPFNYVNAGFESVHTSLVIKDWDGNEYVLCHDTAASCIDRGFNPSKARIWVCGHVHDHYKELGNVINAGVEVRNFYPMSFDEVRGIREKLLKTMWEEWKEKHAGNEDPLPGLP